MKRLSSEIDSYLSLTLGIVLPVAYGVAMRGSVEWLIGPGFLGIVFGSLVGLVLGVFGASDKSALGSQKIIAVLGIALNVLWLAGALVLMGASINSNAQLF